MKDNFHIYDNHMSSYMLLRGGPGGILFNKDYREQTE